MDQLVLLFDMTTWDVAIVATYLVSPGDTVSW